MKYDIRLLKQDEYPEVKKLAEICKVQEEIDMGADFIGARNGNLIGVSGVDLESRRYPVFEHIIIHPDYQKSKLGILLMRRMEEYLLSKGKDMYVSYITNDMNWMQIYAIKWGMTSYANNDRGIWFNKVIRKER